MVLRGFQPVHDDDVGVFLPLIERGDQFLNPALEQPNNLKRKTSVIRCGIIWKK